MSGEITRGGKPVRPTFNYTDGDTFSNEQISAQMSESIRNVLESIERQLATLDQLFACPKFSSMPRDLKKLVRNTTKRKYVRKVAP